jgi:hypothetical protein
MIRIVNKIASGTEFTVLMLMVISAHLLPKRRLVHHQLLKPVREEAVLPVYAVATLRKALAEL